MLLGTEVGLGPDDIVLDGDPAPPRHKGGGAPLPNFSHMYWWLVSDAAYYHSSLMIRFVGSRPSDHYFRSVCLSVCLFVQSFSQPSLIRFRSN